MNTVAPEVSLRELIRPSARPDLWTIAIWLVASLVTVFFALVLRDSTILDTTYLPRGNDSLYHARRILDAAVGSRGFYQFDERLHAPDGAWIAWPWAYDYFMAKATQVALWIQPALDPMAFIVYVPVAWIFVNSALFLAATGEIGLSREIRMLAMICFSLSPLTQLLHSIGMIDHHYVEHTFVLLSIWLGLRWFKRPDGRGTAVALGIALGAATAFHNGLFILQLLPLTTVFLLWLRGAPPAPRTLRAFGLALVLTTQLMLLPSEPFRNGMFEFGLHSWFHLYIAVCTAATIAYMAWRPFSRANLGWFAALCAGLAVPLMAQVLSAAAFLSGSFSILNDIAEVRSPYAMFTKTMGPVETASWYSWLLLVAPALLAFYSYRVVRERQPERLFYAVAVTFGLALLLDQFRFHYFGFFGFVTGGLLLVEDLRRRYTWHRGITFVAAFAAIVLAYQPSLRERLFEYYAPGADIEYASAIALFGELGKLCAEDPGIVLASTDDGSAILFHSECGVIANNHILRPEDKAHIDEIDRLMAMSPGQIRVARPDVKYLLIRVRDFSTFKNNVAYVVEQIPLAKQLLIEATPPPGYTLIKTVRRQVSAGGPAGTYAKLFKVSPLNAESP